VRTSSLPIWGAKPTERALLHAGALTWSFHWIHRCLMSRPRLKAMAFCFGNQSNLNSTLLAFSFTASVALKVLPVRLNVNPPYGPAPAEDLRMSMYSCASMVLPKMDFGHLISLKPGKIKPSLPSFTGREVLGQGTLAPATSG